MDERSTCGMSAQRVRVHEGRKYGIGGMWLPAGLDARARGGWVRCVGGVAYGGGESSRRPSAVARVSRSALVVILDLAVIKKTGISRKALQNGREEAGGRAFGTGLGMIALLFRFTIDG